MTEPMSKAEKIQHEFVEYGWGDHKCGLKIEVDDYRGRGWERCRRPREAHINSQEKQGGKHGRD